MKNLLTKMAPPGIEKTNLGRLYKVIADLGIAAADDATKVLRNFFPFLADSKALAAHGKALSIPRYSNDTDESYRKRVATAMFYIRQRGTRGFFKTAISQRFEGRGFELIEEFMHLTVKILDMTEKDRAWLYEFLEAELDPNILIALVDWFKWVERFEMQESFAIEAVPYLFDAWNWGLTLDGQILLDHGRGVSLDGSFLLDGGEELDGVKAVAGTWTGSRSVDFLLSGSVPLDGREDLDAEILVEVEKGEGAATLSGGTDDFLVIGIKAGLSDAVLMVARLDGWMPLDGEHLLGEEPGVFAGEDFEMNVRRIV